MTGARFSIGQALTAGLRLPVRHPLAALVWGGLIMAFTAVTYALMWPMFEAFPLTPGSDPQAFESRMAASIGPLSGVFNLLSLVQIGLSLVIWTAAMRATLRIGRPDKWFFMRVGMDELRVAVMMVALFVGLYILIFVVALLGVAVGAVLYAVSEIALVIGVFAMVLIGLIGLLAIWSRVCLLAPASVVLGEFAFVEAWRMGRGQTLKLMALNLAVWVIYMLVYVVVGGIVAAILIGGFFASGGAWPDEPQTVGDLLAVVQPMMGWIVLAFVPLTLFAGWAISFTAGALTSATRQLADGAPVVGVASDARDGADASR